MTEHTTKRRSDSTREHDIAHPQEVRAGPGDTGASGRPEPLPETPDTRKRGWKSVVLFCALAAAALLIISVFNTSATP